MKSRSTNTQQKNEANIYSQKDNLFPRDQRGKSRAGKMDPFLDALVATNVGFALSGSLVDSANKIKVQIKGNSNWRNWNFFSLSRSGIIGSKKQAIHWEKYLWYEIGTTT